METSLQQLEKQLETAANNPNKDKNDRFEQVMGGFAKSVRDQLGLLQSMHSKMEKCCTDLAAYFCFDPVKYPVEECFGDIQRFVSDLRKAHDDNLKVREAEERARLAQIAHEKALKERQNIVQKRYAAELSGGKLHFSSMNNYCMSLMYKYFVF